MGHLLAVAPYEDFVREHAPIMFGIICVLLALLVIRLVVRTMTRVILLSLLLLIALFIGIERDNITQCAQTCKCHLAGFDVSVAYCEPKIAA